MEERGGRREGRTSVSLVLRGGGPHCGRRGEGGGVDYGKEARVKEGGGEGGGGWFERWE